MASFSLLSLLTLHLATGHPGNPSNPGHPDNPSNPGNPDNPGHPDNPGRPGHPGHPDLHSAEPTGLLFVGGFGAKTSVELWSPAPHEVQCSLPSLDKSMNSPSVDWMEGSVVACYYFRCYQLTGAGWQMGQNTFFNRRGHTSAVTSQGLLLLGGDDSPSTTELLPLGGGQAQQSFTLDPPREGHCSIQVSDSTVIVTGGFSTWSLTTEYSGLGPAGEVVITELAGLEQGRYLHACGAFSVDGRQKLIVSGGYSHLEVADLATTEVLDYPAGRTSAWREAGQLPSARRAARGVSLAGVFHVTGGYYGGGYLADILAWDPVSETWALAGQLTNPRDFHAVTEVPLAAVNEFCKQR